MQILPNSPRCDQQNERKARNPHAEQRSEQVQKENGALAIHSVEHSRESRVVDLSKDICDRVDCSHSGVDVIDFDEDDATLQTYSVESNRFHAQLLVPDRAYFKIQFLPNQSKYNNNLVGLRITEV